MARLLQNTTATEIHVTGTVQGVGFRPHVYKLATAVGLTGWVINTTAGVVIRLEGDAAGIKRFAGELQGSPPPLARIESFSMRDVQPEGFSAFFIHESVPVPGTEISIPPDVGTCPDCLSEYFDGEEASGSHGSAAGKLDEAAEGACLANRRHGYAFTNCVNCGPRFSITKATPYDRKNTSMQVFKMCPDCEREYADPANRRFHAEPNACPVCGPQLILTSPDGEPVSDLQPVSGGQTVSGAKLSGLAVAAKVRALLKEGKILAIKGIGGYHLACDAVSEAAVKLLRERKRRQGKPFALMMRDLETVRAHCELSAEEEGLLTSPARPILLLKRREPGAAAALCEDIAPGLDTLGVMLPYTPLHFGLFDEDISVLVMTSANISGDPLILSEDDAYRELGALADYFVVHKREIVNRADDSVVMLFRGKEYFVRRARGYVPQGVKLPLAVSPTLAIGGDLKSVFAYGKGEKAILSQYFGDLDNLKNLEAYKDGVRFFGEFLRIKPEKIVCDLHPGYFSTAFAEELATQVDVPLIKVQHHKAHFASALADAGIGGAAGIDAGIGGEDKRSGQSGSGDSTGEKVLGVVCDGTGYGDDGSIWGCEFFYGDYAKQERVGSLLPFPQPRGDGIAKYPLHMAAVMLCKLWGDEESVLDALGPEAKEILPFAVAQASSSALSIPSSSCGRLFDAAAALCGFSGKTSYEGEAAMRMEAMANRALTQAGDMPVSSYPYTILQGGQEPFPRLSWDFIGEMAEGVLLGEDPAIMATRFHLTVAEGFFEMIKMLSLRYNTEKVVFSGGTFQNRLLINILKDKLEAAAITPYFHARVPANDGGLALGQVMLAQANEH